MKRSLNDLKGYTIRANDGDIGTVYDFYFDDQGWGVRYAVVDTGGWMSDRRVLIASSALDSPDWESRTFPVKLTREQVQNSPSIDTEKAILRQHETDLHSYYGWPIYWGGPIQGVFQAAPLLVMDAEDEDEDETLQEEPERDTHLRSASEITGCHIEATDGEIGHMEDFMVDDETWAISYLLVGTRNWLPGKKVLVSPKWIKHLCWEKSNIQVDLTRDAIKDSPEFDPRKPVTPEVEGKLHDYYGRPMD